MNEEGKDTYHLSISFIIWSSDFESHKRQNTCYSTRRSILGSDGMTKSDFSLTIT